MPTIKVRRIPHEHDEEHVMRRLAKSVVVLWDSLREIDQTAILAQAGMIYDPEETAQLREQIKAFIEKHREEDHS